MPSFEQPLPLDENTIITERVPATVQAEQLSYLHCNLQYDTQNPAAIYTVFNEKERNTPVGTWHFSRELIRESVQFPERALIGQGDVRFTTQMSGVNSEIPKYLNVHLGTDKEKTTVSLPYGGVAAFLARTDMLVDKNSEDKRMALAVELALVHIFTSKE